MDSRSKNNSSCISLEEKFANLTYRIIAEAKEQIADARRQAESSYTKLAQQLELFMKAILEIMDGNSPDVRWIRRL